MSKRAVFMGSPSFAIPVLKKLVEVYEVVGVVTQPDRPAGRGRILTPPPIKNLAISLKIPVIQPEKLKQPEAINQLKNWQADFFVVAAFGQILRAEILGMPPHGCINVHASLLPRWRGAAPIQAAILNGDSQTGITIMKMDTGVDTGPLLAQKTLTILPEDTAGSLSERLSMLGAQLLVDTLPLYLEGGIHPEIQNEELATRAPMFTKEDGRLNFTLSVINLENRVRAFQPWPEAFMDWQGSPLKILRAHSVKKLSSAAGTRGVIEGEPAVQASDGWLVLDEVKPAGKKAMRGAEFLRGAVNWNQVK